MNPLKFFGCSFSESRLADFAKLLIFTAAQSTFYGLHKQHLVEECSNPTNSSDISTALHFAQTKKYDSKAMCTLQKLHDTLVKKELQHYLRRML